jgi:four helix bundle protein
MQPQYFRHEKLDVYAKALAFAQLSVSWFEHWPATVSVRDQLDRASESLVTNLVKAVSSNQTDQGIYCLECSLGSVLECSACLDVARIKGVLSEAQVHAGKQSLKSIAQMEMGLRRSWRPSVHEESEPFEAGKALYFSHESLQVYQRSLQFFDVLETRTLSGVCKGHRYVRKTDEAATSLVLNIAEGNGRFSRLDHGHFIRIAQDAGSKLAAYIDLLGVSSSIETQTPKALLREVMAMLWGLEEYLEGTK